MKTRIIVDSTVDVAPSVREKLTVVPLTVFFGEEEYIDGVTINHKQFYAKLIESDVLPTTSQPSPDSFAKIFAEVTQAGEQAVVLTISSKLSGTYQSACIAAEDFSGIYVVDTLSAAIGSGILAELGLQLAEDGLDAKTIAQRLTEERKNVHLVAMIDTLEYLKKGGRLSPTAAFAGSLLSIKPVISVPNGEIAILGKARGSRRGNNLLIEEIGKAGGVDFSKPLMLGYTGLSDDLLQKYIEDSAHLWDGNVEQLRSTLICSVIGTHVGPGAIAVAFFCNNANT